MHGKYNDHASFKVDQSEAYIMQIGVVISIFQPSLDLSFILLTFLNQTNHMVNNNHTYIWTPKWSQSDQNKFNFSRDFLFQIVGENFGHFVTFTT